MLCFSALKIAEADTCLVICSAASASSVPEAAKHAKLLRVVLIKFKWTIHKVVFSEIDEINTASASLSIECGRSRCQHDGWHNTHGPSLFNDLWEEAQKLDRPMRAFLFSLTRRPPDEQASNPFGSR